MDLLYFLNIMIIVAIVLAIFTTLLLIFALKVAKSSHKRQNELMAIQKENLLIQKAILSELKELKKGNDEKIDLY
ncbi:hypothetical protein [Saliterribacillus persicus]|uniref:Uncharacterized protein n=1 Tax=Saliterribacillus persicus TaxID=930114 RepID=A0A368YEJ6_9BACI|nr:hypothetical protein [Saliterribacillus persicus]RCW77307.1 hypothetical protein DFR57_101176 [Saliterribacillus persicus]